MFVGIVKLDFHLPYCHSLKEKRSHIRKIKGGLLSKFEVRAAEVGFQDKWQRAEIGFALVSGDQRILVSIIDKTLSFIEGLGLGEVIDCQREIVSF